MIAQGVRSFALMLLLLLAFACGDDGDGSDEPPFPVQGLLTEVQTSDAGELEGISLRDEDGAEWDFAVALDNPASVTAAHLEEHIRLNWGVLVYFRGEGENRTAYEINDASAEPTN